MVVVPPEVELELLTLFALLGGEPSELVSGLTTESLGLLRRFESGLIKPEEAEAAPAWAPQLPKFEFGCELCC